MYLVELILDGFKSYPVRTSVNSWDPSFNAITGLNGSGKSNILDAICFVLGITNMSTVRASNLIDLIYKRGQAGVTRASVTIVFNNSDKTKAPLGFENMAEISVTRQIALNGTSKYLLCGHRSTQTNVQNLFQSVQLNINNPNFLIMQGKITKVLNMRPQEILSMIEEAAGTSMFEEKKEKAVKTMARKEKRLDEIQELLREEITPKLDKLREEKRAFLDFQKKTSELERLTKLVVAFDWVRLQDRKVKGAEEMVKSEEARKSAEEGRKRMDVEITRMEKEVDEIKARRDKELAKGGKRQRLIEEQNVMARDHSKLAAQVDITAGNVKEEDAKISELEANAKELTSQRAAKQLSCTASADAFSALKSSYDASVLSLKASEDLLQTLLTGISSSSDAESTSKGFMGQLAAARRLASSMGTEAERAKKRIEHLQKEVKDKEPKAKKAALEGKGLLTELEAMKSERGALEIALGKLGWNEEKAETLRNRKDAEGSAVRRLLEEKDAIKSNLASLEFDYSDPHRGFDRSSVKGLIANLISLDEANSHAAAALEVCAGGRLYNVVVTDEDVGSDLLKRGQLRKRVTIIPLTKISAKVASKNTLAAVAKVSPKTSLALSLVGYEDEVSKAMEFVFGNTLICPDAATANLVTFHREIQMRSVTLDGDVYDPTGTLSGGSKSSGGGVLVKVQKLRRVEMELEAKKKALAVVEREWEQEKAAMDKFKGAQKALDLKTHELGLLQERVNESNATRIISEVDAIKANIVELTASIVESKQKERDASIECDRIQKEMDEFKNNRGAKLDQIKVRNSDSRPFVRDRRIDSATLYPQAEITKKKAEITKQTAGVKTLQREVQTAELELEQMEKDIAAGGVELAEARTHIATTRETLKGLQADVDAKTKELKVIEAKIAVETKMLTAFDDELNALDLAIKAKNQEIADGELRIEELKQHVEKLKRENKGAAEAVAKLENQYAWIDDEKLTFGSENSPYYFGGVQMADVKSKCATLEAEQQGMKKKVNPKVLSMIDSVEKKEKELMIMYRQVLSDKSKIEKTVAKLDGYKKEQLQNTWEKVDAEFGNIFAELLPGNFSKLVPPEGMDITQGLEVKVRLGTVWKSSLTELSGGQRAALADVDFAPRAPMYILDEIDAALDLSHTENIGRLFRTRFKGSQFIVVSLKDGLFSNANVLFRTKFRDGTSLVERSTQRSTSSMYQNDKENSSARPGVSKGKGRADRVQTSTGSTGALRVED
ncbi:structural maintenance of chromosome 2, partial [Phenoliferia sp. Uapishka_3]